MNGIWDSDMDFVNCCGKLPNNFSVKFFPKVYIKINALMEKKQDIEWLTFLLGYIDWDNDYAVVEDLHIPESQSVTGGNVDDIDCDDFIRGKIIGVMHSHHKMGCFFSGDDWDYLNNNHNISIVVSNKSGKNEFKSVVRFKTPCGSYSHVEASINIHCEIDQAELDEFENEIDEKIKFGMAEFNKYTPGVYRFQSPHINRRIVDDIPDEFTYDEMLYYGLM